MAYVAAKDITAVTWNSKALMPWVESISGLKINAVFEDRTPMGAAWPVPIDTGYRNHDDIVIEFLYDSAGTPTPNADVTLGLSAALSITLGTTQTISGTCVVGDLAVEVATDKINRLTATFKPSGTITYDLVV